MQLGTLHKQRNSTYIHVLSLEIDRVATSLGVLLKLKIACGETKWLEHHITQLF